MKNLEKILGVATPELLDSQYVVAVVRHKGVVRWLLLEPESLILDWIKQRDEFIAAGYQFPDLNVIAAQRGGIVVLDQDTVDDFLRAPEVHELSLDFLRKALLERFQSAHSWWDVAFLFPIAFVDFDRKSFAGFYQNGPCLERYVPDGWDGEFTDFANTYPEEVFPTTDKFWIVDGQDLLRELNERGRTVDVTRIKVD
ncbi:group-specific protein [Janthinobacterium sp. FT14W]|uniref:group-specific protein n=1 Tax=Janthinobacterium sp. FT14W TaxID=2654253 RepID=UPI0012645ADD|nr:group-specific protein [Janthinobacterium sp. FT14W]KAB8053538.1 group-specific protein [Janthinobacterium sp. FT14W]